MKKTGFCFTLIFLAVAWNALADWHVKGIMHIPGGYRYGHNVPDAEIAYEWWFGKEKVTFISKGWGAFDYYPSNDWRLTWDKRKNRLIAANLKGKWFMMIVLNENTQSFFESRFQGQNSADYFKTFRMGGTVAGIDSSPVILDNKCQSFHLDEWIQGSQGNQIYQSERVIRVAARVPFEWTVFNELREWLTAFVHPEEQYLKEVKKIRGFVLREESILYELAGQQTWVFNVNEILRVPTAENVFDIPPGSVRQKTISPNYILDMLALFHPIPIY